MPLLKVCAVKCVEYSEHNRFLSTKDLSPLPCVDASRIGRCIWGRDTDYLGGFPCMCSAPASKCRDNAFEYSMTASNHFLFTIHTDYLGGLPWMCSAPPSKCRDNAFEYSTTTCNHFFFVYNPSFTTVTTFDAAILPSYETSSLNKLRKQIQQK